MEHWEQFFVEKSRRRFKRERIERRKSLAKLTIAAVAVLLLVIGAIMGLGALG